MARLSGGRAEGRFGTAELGRLAGYSTQQVRDLERLRVIPLAERVPNGYRRYDGRHLVALRAYRALAAAVGPVVARRIMPELVAGTVDEAAETIDELHAGIARERARVREARDGLDAVLAGPELPAAPELPTGHETSTGPEASAGRAAFDERDAMSIGELAQALGVRRSALRHWEREGLVRPDRSSASGARRYGAVATAEARIAAALRLGGYGIPGIRAVLEQLRADGLTADARRILNERLADLTRRSVALLAASGRLHELLTEPTAQPLPTARA